MEVMVLKSVISDDLYRSCDWRHGGHGFKVCDICIDDLYRSICIGVVDGFKVCDIMEVMVLKSMISDDLYRSCDWRHGGHGFKVYDIR